MKMICKRPYRGRPGEKAFLYGYPGVFGDDGVAVLDVPEAFAETEERTGRLVVAEVPMAETTPARDESVRKARGAARGGSVSPTAAQQ